MKKNTSNCSKCYGVLTIYDETCPHCKNKDVKAERKFSIKLRKYLFLNIFLILIGLISFGICFWINVSLVIPIKILNVSCLFTGIIFFLCWHLAGNSRDKHVQTTFLLSSLPVLVMVIYGVLMLVFGIDSI